MESLKTIYLVRHGHFDMLDSKNSIEGKCLLPSGIQQAELTGELLASFGSKFNCIYSSDYSRARQTAEIIASKLINVPHQIDSDLREINNRYYYRQGASSVLEPLTELERADHPPSAVTAFDKYFVKQPPTSKSEVIVCHGNLITYFLSRLIQLSEFEWQSLYIHYCSITEIRIAATGESDIVSICDERHIPKELQEL